MKRTWNFATKIQAIRERLKVCWMVLTSHTYYTFFVDKPTESDVHGNVRGCFIENPNHFITKTIIYFLQKQNF